MLRIIFCVVTLLHISAGVNYCDLYAKHVMCIYPAGPATACGDHGYNSLSQDDISVIVDEHNKFRNKVATGQETLGKNGGQPSAANMLQMEWDTELATLAQRWANQCSRGHSCASGEQCMKTERWDDLGQNVAGTGSSVKDAKLNFAGNVQQWYSEVKDFDPVLVNAFNSSESGKPAWGHYTQVVWAKSQYIGCGVQTYLSGKWWWRRVTCNYGPAGNWLGSKVYLKGDKCTECPAGTACSSEYPGLCKKSK